MHYRPSQLSGGQNSGYRDLLSLLGGILGLLAGLLGSGLIPTFIPQVHTAIKTTLPPLLRVTMMVS
jgi:ABC-type antimicrobial peptide transport system permease subunit